MSDAPAPRRRVAPAHARLLVPPRTWRAPRARRGGGGGGDGSDGERIADAYPRLISPAEAASASSDPVEDARRAAVLRHERAVELVYQLGRSPADGGWSVHGAETLIDRFGVELVDEVFEYLTAARTRGALGRIRNPGGYFVAWTRDYVSRLVREGRLEHPAAPERQWPGEEPDA